jgi:ubiquinone/menaquinone biosynthesis C-methylase UbiE
MISDNGPVWTFYFVVAYLLAGAGRVFERKMVSLERKRLLPGRFTTDANLREWSEYDWSELGEEWNWSDDWKEHVLNEVALKHISAGGTVLEIGPGAGRWTETLLITAKRMILVDIAPKAIDLCKERFSGHDNISYFVGAGRSLDFIPDKSVDYIWSFDVFVTVNCRDADHYVKEFGRVLRPGGRGVINVFREELYVPIYRSVSLTDDVFCNLLRKHGLRVLEKPAPPQVKRPSDARRFFTIVVFENGSGVR